MKNTLRQVFHSPKFVVGFVIFVAILLTTIIYPLVCPGDPLAMIGLGTFAPPGTYVSLYDAAGAKVNTFKLPDAEANRIAAVMSQEDRVSMLNWLTSMEVDVSGLDINDTASLLKIWKENFDEKAKPAGMTKAQRNYYKRLNNSILAASMTDELTVMAKNDEGELEEQSVVNTTDFVRIGDVPNVLRLPLGTDNFGRDVLKELISAIGTSLKIGFIAGCIATLIGLILGLLSGYIGGFVDDLIMFITNIFIVIPSFVLLILINYSIGQENRGATVVAVVIGLTNWTWTTRSVRSQVLSLRNRDHVNLSKLSGHSLFRIILTDILPYIASYVVMAFILQISSAILSEAQLSLLGLGPKTTEVPTLGLMMNWAMLYSAHLGGKWWAYFPVIGVIALISFSLNLMNTGMDQVFNPTLRD